MIQVTVGNNLTRKRVTVDDDATPREVLTDNGIDYSTATVHMDGVSLQTGDMDKTFAELGITEQTFLIAVTKTTNA